MGEMGGLGVGQQRQPGSQLAAKAVGPPISNHPSLAQTTHLPQLTDISYDALVWRSFKPHNLTHPPPQKHLATALEEASGLDAGVERTGIFFVRRKHFVY